MKNILLGLCFLTSSAFAQNTVTDIDGNSYNYLTYGNQQWTIENAAMETYRDGTAIPQVTETSQWISMTTGAWCYVNNDSTKDKLYNWYAVAGIHDNDPSTPNKHLAPEGWHVPSNIEWNIFQGFLISNNFNYDGTNSGNKIAKALATTDGWNFSSTVGTPGNEPDSNNSSGFNAFPNGDRNLNFYSYGHSPNFWTSSEIDDDEAFARQFFSGSAILYTSPYIKYNGDNVRFVKDEVVSYCKEMNVTRLLDSNNEITTFEISTDEWHYLAITKSDNLAGKIYLDGSLVGEGTFLDVNYNWSQLYLGVSYFTSWRKHFKGWLDEFRVSSVVRSEQEILENFEANTSLELDSSTLGLWHLDEPDGNFFNNSVPGIDDGQLFSGAQFTDGRFGNAVYFDGVDDRGDCFTNIPESNVTFEIWLKIQGEEDQDSAITPFEAYGGFNTSSDIFDNCSVVSNQTTITCAEGLFNDTYCYSANDTTEVVYFSDTGLPLRLTFETGTVELNFDEVIILDSDGVTNLNAGNPYGNGGDMSGFVFESSGDTITLKVASDGIASCSDGFFEPLNYDIYCLTCTDPTIVFTNDGMCETGQEFTIDVAITDLGSATNITVTDNQGNPAQNTTTTSVLIFGPYPATTSVAFTVETGDINCLFQTDIIECQAQGSCDFLDAGIDMFLDCQNSCTDLVADYIALPYLETSSYIIQGPICDLPPVTGGTPMNIILDDVWSAVLDLPFEFNFYGNSYTEIVVGSNGQLSFDTSLTGSYNDWSMDPLDMIPTANYPQNTIFGAYHDLNPSVASDRINYFVNGEAPFRVFVLNFNAVPQFLGDCGELLTTQQILLYESLNVIDVNIINKPVCDTWNDGLAVIGLQGNDLTEFSVPENRNVGVWEVTNENWRFLPNGGPATNESVFEWRDATGNVLSNDTVFTVCPDQTTVYTAALVIELPDGSFDELTDTVTVAKESDTTAPEITCPLDQTIIIDAVCTVEIPDYTGLASVTDNCGDYSITQDPQAGTMVGSGSIIVTITASDGVNISECSFTLFVNDSSVPEITCPPNQTVIIDNNCMYEIPDLTDLAIATDNCSVTSVEQNPIAGTIVGAGPLIITLIASDGLNTTDCNFILSVIDTSPPVLVCPDDQTISSEGAYLLPDYFATGEATATDNCTQPVTETSQIPNPGALLENGTYTITLTAADENGLEGECSFTLVVNDVLEIQNNQLLLSSLRLYPNPASDRVIVSNPELLEIDKVFVYDLNGRLVITNKIGVVEDITIDTSILQSATYMIVIQTQYGKIVKRLLIE